MVCLRYGKEYSLRQYEPFTVAETEQSQNQKSPSKVDVNSFVTLTGYLFGKNEDDKKMAMTIPVNNTSDGKL